MTESVSGLKGINLCSKGKELVKKMIQEKGGSLQIGHWGCITFETFLGLASGPSTLNDVEKVLAVLNKCFKHLGSTNNDRQFLVDPRKKLKEQVRDFHFCCENRKKAKLGRGGAFV